MSAERGRVRSRLPRAVHFLFFMAAVAQAKSFAEKKAAFCEFINAVVVARTHGRGALIFLDRPWEGEEGIIWAIHLP